MVLDGVVQTVAASLLSGIATGGLTVVALRVHIEYLRKEMDKAHHRIDKLDSRLTATREIMIGKLEHEH